MVRLFVKDNTNGCVHEYGTDCHDALVLQEDGSLHYENLQNGCGTMFPDEGYSFCLEDGAEPMWSAPCIDIGGEENAEQIHAHWIIDKGGQWAECSNCHEDEKIAVMVHKDFCPACGAIMDEESVVVSDDDQEVGTRSGETLTVCIVGGKEFQVFVADESERE